MGRTLRFLAAFAALIAQPLTLRALTPLESIRYTPDITVVLGGLTVEDDQVVEDDLAGGVTPIDIGMIPPAAEISAYSRLADGDQLLSFDTPLTLPGGLFVNPGDVVRFDGSAYTLEFDASDEGIPNGVITDAVALFPPSDLLLSFDVTVAVGSVTADDEDLIRVGETTVSLFFDGSAAGVPEGLDLDAVECLDRNGHLLVSFDASGDIDSVLFDDEDVLEFTPTGNAWELAYDGSAAHSNWPAADLTAFAAVVANESAPTAPTIGGSQPGPDGRGTGGLIVGTNRLFGSGTPHGKPGDECIAIFEVGPNGNPDNPPGSIDDELLGTGGTDENGVFVDAMSNPGIPLTRQVREGDRVFAVDVCEGLLVGHVIGFVAPTPVLSGLALFALTALLLLFGIWKVASGDKLRPNGEEF